MISPTNAKKIVNNTNINKFKLIFISLYFKNKRPVKRAKINPPINPSTVLFGLTLINCFFPNELPIK